MTETAEPNVVTRTLSGRVVIVTGGSRGLGLEISRRLTAAGARVVRVARDAAMLAESRGAVGGDPLDLAINLADPDGPDAVVDRVLNQVGHVDVLVNNAAVQGPIGPLEAVDFTAWRAVFDVNLFAAMRLCQRVIPVMRQRTAAGHGRGKMINLSGGGATGPRPDFSAYAATKVAVVRLTETLAVELNELADAGIDVNAVAPGALNTRMLTETIAAGPAAAPHEYEAAVKRQQAGGDDPAQAAELVEFLASAASDGITGRLLSAVWDDWASLPEHVAALKNNADLFTLRRVTPKDRGLSW